MFALYPTPGLKLATTLPLFGFTTSPASPIRALIVSGGRCFAIVGTDNIGSNFTEITITNGVYGFTLIGTMPALPGVEPSVSVCSGVGHGGTVLMAVDGGTFIFSPGTGFVDISATVAIQTTRVGYSDGFYLATDGVVLKASAVNDATTWPGAS